MRVSFSAKKADAYSRPCVEAVSPTAEPISMYQASRVSPAVKRPDSSNGAATMSPRNRKAAPEGMTKNTSRSSEVDSRAFSASRRVAASSDMAGSSEAEIAMPNRLTGSMEIVWVWKSTDEARSPASDAQN